MERPGLKHPVLLGLETEIVSQNNVFFTYNFHHGKVTGFAICIQTEFQSLACSNTGWSDHCKQT